MKTLSTLLWYGAVVFFAVISPTTARLVTSGAPSCSDAVCIGDDAISPAEAPQGNGGCDGISPRTLTYSPSAYSAAAFSSELNVLRDQMLGNPACRIVVTGNGGASKIEQQMSWMRVNALIAYMNDTHDISRDRFIFLYGQSGDASTVTVRPATDEEGGPSNVPQPHPGLMR